MKNLTTPMNSSLILFTLLIRAVDTDRTINNDSLSATDISNIKILRSRINEYQTSTDAESACDEYIKDLSIRINKCEKLKEDLPQFTLNTMEDPIQRSKFMKDLADIGGQYSLMANSIKKDNPFIKDLIYLKKGTSERIVNVEYSDFIINKTTYMKNVLDDILTAMKIYDAILKVTEKETEETAFIDKDSIKEIILEQWTVIEKYWQLRRKFTDAEDPVYTATGMCHAILRVMEKQIGNHRYIYKGAIKELILGRPVKTIPKRYKQLKSGSLEVEKTYHNLEKILILIENEIEYKTKKDIKTAIIQIGSDIQGDKVDDMEKVD